jgi:hypothetical protein
VLLHLQLVHLPEELLEQLATFRADALLKLIHDLFGRQGSVELTSHADLPSDDLR